MATSGETPTVELAVDAKCNLGESPIWDKKTQTLYFVDINENSVHGFKPTTNEHFVIKIDQPAGTVVPTTDPDRLLVAGKRGIVEVDVPHRRLTGRVLAETPEEHGNENYRFNDGKVSPSGAFVVGWLSSKWRQGERGRLYRLDPGSSVLVEVMGPDEILVPNGITWDESKPGIVYYIDSTIEEVRAYVADGEGAPLRDPGTGRLSYRTVAFTPNEGKTPPDGMTIDTQGNLWVTHGESGAVTCYDATTGEVLHKIDLPVRRVTACTFGGEDLRDLYVTSRVEKGDDASPHHGGLFRIRIPGVAGVAAAYEYPI